MLPDEFDYYTPTSLDEAVQLLSTRDEAKILAGMEPAHTLLTELGAIEAELTPFTYVVIAIHGNDDELALERALKTEVPYVGLVAC